MKKVIQSYVLDLIKSRYTYIKNQYSFKALWNNLEGLFILISLRSNNNVIL